jgi:signal transduction histidine kinase
VTAKAINGHFAVSVADTGPGIPEHAQSRIFEKFHQIDSSNTKAKGGTGLGLAIAKRIVEMHGAVESTIGKGYRTARAGTPGPLSLPTPTCGLCSGMVPTAQNSD